MLLWACTENGRKQNSQKSIIYEFGNKKAKSRPRSRWQDEVREDGRLVGGKWWKERVYNIEELKKFLRTARNRHILHMPMD
jgi:hypothetical protein